MKTTFLFAAVLTLLVLTGAPAEGQFVYATNEGTISITGYTGPGGDVTIPGTVDGLPVTRIGNRTFFGGTNLTSVTIPDSVTAIGDWAFARCYSLSELRLPGNVISIGEGAFYLCTGLTNVALPGGVTKIDDWTFSGCAYLSEITFGNNVNDIDDRAFSHCFSLRSITIPDGVKKIGTKAFSSCYTLTNVTIGNSVATIEDSAFSDCFSLTNVTIGKSVAQIGDWAFFLCANLRAINFRGHRPTSVGSGSFAGADNATIYYLPGTVGWDSTFEGLPTALWSLPQPILLDFGPSFGVQSNRFGFVISWATNLAVVVEASGTLDAATWSPASTNTLADGWTHFRDPTRNDGVTRFYRVRAY